MSIKFTIDCELDFGGRTTGDEGIKKGIPRILEAFRAYNVKALFFISTEILPTHKGVVRDILSAGHLIGSHSHFHIKYKDKWRAEKDKEISKTLLSVFTGSMDMPYRAPKFSYDDGNVYANPSSHVGLLKHTWFGGKIEPNAIFYLHPFDIVGGKNPPNLFCRIWYSKPEVAYENFIILLKYYPGNHRLR